jgi:lipid-A-disaccharide synthase
MKIFFSVGEPSGDLHGANLIRQLRQQAPDVQCVGFGGPRMAAAGCQLLADLTELAVMWFLRAVLNLHRFWFLYRSAKRYFRDQRPDAVVLIDYPGFNWWIARAAKRYEIPVFYYGVPQMWAWAPWRVRKMRRLVDHVLCKLPFEAHWFQQRGCQATYVGHPYFDQLSGQTLDQAFLSEMRRDGEPLITILPGSRTQEVLANLPWLLKTAALIQRRLGNARFAVASFNERQAEIACRMVADSMLAAEVFVGRTGELIQASRCCLACSGSVSLELLFYTKPSLILYWVQRFPLRVATRLFIKVRFITLVNLLADANPFLSPGQHYDASAASADAVPLPEYLTCDDPSRVMADRIVGWLKDDAVYQRRVKQLADLKRRHADTGASRIAAAYMLDVLHQPASIPGPGPKRHADSCSGKRSA